MSNYDDKVQELLVLLNDISSGAISIVEGCRKVIAFQNRLHMHDNINFSVFESIDSETDHFPIGEARQYWNKESLTKYEIEIREYEEDVKDDVKKACEKLIKELSEQKKH